MCLLQPFQDWFLVKNSSNLTTCVWGLSTFNICHSTMISFSFFILTGPEGANPKVRKPKVILIGRPHLTHTLTGGGPPNHDFPSFGSTQSILNCPFSDPNLLFLTWTYFFLKKNFRIGYMIRFRSDPISQSISAQQYCVYSQDFNLSQQFRILAMLINTAFGFQV